MAKTSEKPASGLAAGNADNVVQTFAQPDPATGLPPWIADEHAGQGGDYVFDPATGRRTRVGGPALPDTAA